MSVDNQWKLSTKFPIKKSQHLANGASSGIPWRQQWGAEQIERDSVLPYRHVDLGHRRILETRCSRAVVVQNAIVVVKPEASDPLAPARLPGVLILDIAPARRPPEDQERDLRRFAVPGRRRLSAGSRGRVTSGLRSLLNTEEG